jgi:large subunit ribosomal protein L21
MILQTSKSYAIIQTCGRQLIARPGNWYDVDLLKQNFIGDFLYLYKILFFQKEKKIQVGRPFLKELKIPAKIIQIIKGKKIIIVKTKPKKNYLRMKGHRQYYTRIQFDNIIH